MMVGEKPLKSVLTSLFTRLTDPEQQKKTALVDCWPKIAGEQFSKHTQPRFTVDRKVVVCVDDSTLAFELSRRYKAVLLKRLRNQFGEDEVKDIKFFVGQLR